MQNLREIARMVRAHDYERYLCCLFAPPSHRAPLLALLAFNHEIAKTAEAASEPAIGAIRLKWWHEAVQEIAAGKKPRRHEVVEALAEAMAGGISAADLYPLIDARLADVECRKGFKNRAAFDHYIDSTSGALLVVMARCIDASAAQAHGETINSLARPFAMMGLLRAIPYHAERGIVRWPHDSLRQFGLSPAAVEQGVEAQALRHFANHWLQEIAQQASHLRARVNALPDDFLFLKQLHIITLLYANRLKDHEGDISSVVARLPNLPLQLWWYSKRGFKPLLV